MSVYRDTTNEVQQEGFIKRLYRVESNKSSQNMKMDEMGRLKYQNSDIYTYFSTTDRHHQYFLDKRFSSYLNDILKQNGLSINRNNILDPKTYSVIKNLIIKNADLSLFLGMKL